MTKEAMQKIGEWARGTAKTLGIELEISDEGISSLLIGNDFTIAIEVPEEGEWFYLYAPIREVAAESIEEGFAYLQRALELNAFQAKTRGGAIGLVPGQSLLIYSMLRPIQGCDEQIFTETISQFHEAAKSLLLDLDIK